MKRPITAGEDDGDASKKKLKQAEDPEEISDQVDGVLLDENLLYEVLRHVDDGRTLAKAACVSQQWRRTAQDERIWEQICTRHYHRSPMQLRVVVLALGGFRRLYSSHLWPLLKPPSPSTAPQGSSAWPCLPVASPPAVRRSKVRWGKDEVNLSLSLLSIKYFEKMSFTKMSK